MILKIKFRALLTLCSEPIENGVLIIENGNILEVVSEPSYESTDNILDLSDHLLMPGFVNAHSHLGLTALANKISYASNFARWIGDLISLDSALSDEERRRNIIAGASEMKSSGVTGLADYVADSALLKSIYELGFRCVLFLETIGFQESKAESVAYEMEAVLKTNKLNLPLGIAPHAPYSVSANLLRRLYDLSKKYGCLFSTHLAETKEEVRFIEKGEGPLLSLLKNRQVFDDNWKLPATSPTRYLESLGVMDDLIAIHCNFIDNDDIKSIKAAVFCPKSTNWFGRSPTIPVRKMLDANIPVALGSDSMASNDSLNFLEEICMADKLLPDVSRKEILTMATRYGAEILRFPCGKIEAGQKADVIGFRIDTEMQDWYDLPFDLGAKKVDFYMINGKF